MEGFVEEVVDSRYVPALLNVHVFWSQGSRTILQAKLLIYNHGPVMWELRRFVKVALEPVPDSWKLSQWVNRQKLVWQPGFEQFHNFDTHYKPSRKAALADGGEVVLDPMVRQDYTIRTPLLLYMMLDLIRYASTTECKAARLTGMSPL